MHIEVLKLFLYVNFICLQAPGIIIYSRSFYVVVYLMLWYNTGRYYIILGKLRAILASRTGNTM